MDHSMHGTTPELPMEALKRMLHGLTHLRNRYLIGIDTVGLVLSPALAFLLRTESTDQFATHWHAIVGYTLLMVLMRWVVFYRVGLYKALWAYASVQELLLVVRAVTVTGLLEIMLFFMVMGFSGNFGNGFPRSIPLLSALLTAFHVTGVRFSIRVIFALVSRREFQSVKSKPVLIAGAGTGGIAVARELQRNLHLGLVPIGFVDDDPKKCTKMICGVPVFGLFSDIPWVAQRHNIKEVIIAMPAASGQVIRRVVQICKEAGVPSKITPGLFDILRGAARVVNVREIQLEDLLRREVLESNPETVRAAVGGARVLVTGAGGSIGSEIVRQLKNFRPAELILLGHGETSIFHMMKELEEHPVPGMVVTPVIADVRDLERMQQVFFKHRPQIIFHAAAHKHVWLMEQNLPDAITNNVMGTRVLVTLAEKFGVRRFVMISSDKAVNPTNVMGATKRAAEIFCQSFAQQSKTHFITVRFGNVLDSAGSVVPLFRDQIRRGGPVTVTHPEISRYFMTIPEACQLILQAAVLGRGGEIFALDMGAPVRIRYLAEQMILLAGKVPERDIQIVYTGLRAGEKLFEELFHEQENHESTGHPKIFLSQPRLVAFVELTLIMRTLDAAVRRFDEGEALRLLQSLVPEFDQSRTDRDADIVSIHKAVS